MTNTDKKITINGNQENFEPAPFIHPQPFIQPQCVSSHVVPSQTDSATFAQEVRINKLKNFEISMTYYKEEFSRPLKPIDTTMFRESHYKTILKKLESSVLLLFSK